MSAGRPPSVAALLDEAQRAISKARYDAALEWLQQASLLAPDDDEINQLLAQTEMASRRHQAATARHRLAIEWGRKIETMIEHDELEAARGKLREAGVELGKHDVFTALEKRLAEREDIARQGLATELAGKARALFDAGDQRGALKVAEQSLRFEAVAEAQEVRELASAELNREAERRQYHQAVAEAVDDVERLLGARELAHAGRRLSRAKDQLGSHEAFDELKRRVDRGKSDLQFRQRVEWAERRSKEADGLVVEAARLSLKGAYSEAIVRLETAHELDPSRPDLDDKLETARAAYQHQLAQQQRSDALAQHLVGVKSHLEALRLDDAEEAIRQGTEEFGETARFAPLATRLRRLREVEHSGQAMPTSGQSIDGEAETAMLRRQQVLAAAYSWKQTFLYPFRGFGPTAFWFLLGLLVTLDVLSTISRIGFLFDVLSLLVLLATAGLIPQLVRATLEGRNLLPTWGELANPASSAISSTGRTSWGRDLPRLLGLAALGGSPLIVLLATRPWHGIPATDSGLLTWLTMATLAWLGVAFLVVAVGAAEAFGARHAPRLKEHARGLLASGSDALLAVNIVFLIGLLAVELALVPVAQWLFSPLARALQAYGLLLAPHIIGVLVRRHRLELNKIYH